MTDYENNRAVPRALPTGYRFNEFEIKEVIGGGGFGIVYRAWDHQLERTIAIKEFMPLSLAVRNDDMRLVLRSDRFRKAFVAGLNSFIQEARLLARFSHPNLLHVLRFWVQNDTAYMGTVFLSGTTLSRLSRQHPGMINEAWIRRMLPMLFGAIKTIHDEGYLHCDISLDNIQIQDNGLPVLLDFGSARRSIGNISDDTETMLRPGFAPIEQYTDDNESEQGPWTDIYALGAVLHTLIMGAPPPVSVVRSITENYRPLAELRPEGYSPLLLQGIDRALALKAEDRPQSVEEFAALLEIPVAGPDDIMNVRKPGTMLVPVEKGGATSAAERSGSRYKIAGLIAAGILVGVIAGRGLSGGGGDERVPETVSQNSAPPEQVSAPQPGQDIAPAVTTRQGGTTEQNADARVAQLYVRMDKDEQLVVNGKIQIVTPDENGFASLQLPVGDYELTIKGRDRPRSQSLTVSRPGTWLISPQIQ
ncbi:serine/threonine protein kinase [Escherichia coli]|nr:serine/threonine protein kinase [Escherichia coli]